MIEAVRKVRGEFQKGRKDERQKKMEREKRQERWPGHLLTLSSTLPFSLFNNLKQMTQGNVGSLLVFDPAKAGAAGTGGSVAPGDAVVGIVTERGEFVFFSSFFLVFSFPHEEEPALAPSPLNPNSTLHGRCRASVSFALAGAEGQKRAGIVLCCSEPSRESEREFGAAEEIDDDAFFFLLSTSPPPLFHLDLFFKTGKTENRLPHQGRGPGQAVLVPARARDHDREVQAADGASAGK